MSWNAINTFCQSAQFFYVIATVILGGLFTRAIKVSWSRASAAVQEDIAKSKAQQKVLEDHKSDLIEEISQLTRERMDALQAKLGECESLIDAQRARLTAFDVRVQGLERENELLKKQAVTRDQTLALQEGRIRVLETELARNNIPIPPVEGMPNVL